MYHPFESTIFYSLNNAYRMRFCMCDCCNVCIFVSHVLSDLSVVMSTSTIQFEYKNDTISSNVFLLCFI